MTLILALLEGILVSAMASAVSWIQGVPLLDAAVLGRAGFLALCCATAFYYTDLYDFRVVSNFGKYFYRLPKGIFFALFSLIVCYLLFPKTDFFQNPWDCLLILLAITVFLLPLRAAFYAVLKSTHFTKRTLVLGAGPLARSLLQEITAQPQVRYNVIGVVDDNVYGGNGLLSYPTFGPFKNLSKIIDETRPDRIIVALSQGEILPLRDLLQAQLHGITVEDGVKVYERLMGKLAIESLTPSSLIFQDFNKTKFEIGLHRILSLTFALAGVVFILPLMLVVALVIKLDSKGPVFFVQKRVGLRGRTFRLLKFRTMDPARKKTSEWVRDNGDRITRVGKWLRKFRLDELPQVFNIIRGDMDLVGPRPHPVSNYPLFVVTLRNASDFCGEAIPYYPLRCVIRPGITGWAQVRYGYANDLEEEIEKVRYDLYYIKHMSLGLDLRIFLDTIKVALFGQKSEAVPYLPAQYPLEVKDRAE